MRMRSRVGRAGMWVVLGVAVGCASAPESMFGTLVVTVRRDSPSVPASAAKVSILHPPLNAVTSTSGTATFALPAGTFTVRALYIGYCMVTATATVTVGATTAVTLDLGTSPCVVAGDKVTTGGTESFVALLDIRTGNAGDPVPCENDRIVEGAGPTALGVNALTLTDPAVPCHGAGWVFTTDYEPWFNNTTATFPWTNSGGDLLTATLPTDRLRVPVVFWISKLTISASTHRSTLLDFDIPKANGFLLDHRTGLLLANSESSNSLPDVIDVATLGGGTPPYSTIGTGCGNVPQITTSTVVYRPDFINIYVVDAVDGDNNLSGRNCVDYGAPDVIFINQLAGLVTIIHEIGHGIGLSRPHWGHAQYIKNLYVENVMESGASVAGHISLGQITRMHADTFSWLNLDKGSGSVRSRQSTVTPLVTMCSCPGAATDDCPATATDVPRTGTAYPGNADPACHITASVPCLRLAAGETNIVTAYGWTNDLATIPGAGEGLINSLDPAVATAIRAPVDGEGLGYLRAQVTAGSSPGATVVNMSIGGPMITIPVKVGSSCP